MDDITIPDAALEAAYHQWRRIDPIIGTGDVRLIIAAAAPYIVVQALRDADAEVGSYAYTPDDVREVGQGDYVDGITDAHHVFERLLNARADRIEADRG